MTPLSPRQLEVAGLVAADQSYQEIANTLGISRDTVRAHVFAIAQKLPNPHGLPQKSAVQLAYKKAS